MGTRTALVALLAVSCATEHPPAAPAAGTRSASKAASSAPAPKPPGDSEAYEPRPDVVADDPSAPPGTVSVTVLDAEGAPIPRAPIALETVVVRAPAAGLDVLVKDTAIADERGMASFPKRRTDAGVHHVASTQRGDGTFAVEPFKLGTQAGKKVVLHAYETVRDLEHALVAMQAAAYLLVHATKIEIEVLYRIYNLGRIAWVPSGVRVAFPPQVTDFMASDLGMPVRVDDITEAGFALVGTVAPGRHELNYSYQIPREGSGSQRIHLDLPPHVAEVRVLLEARGAARLEVATFPAAQPAAGSAKPVLMTERRVTRTEGLTGLDVTIAGDPG